MCHGEQLLIMMCGQPGSSEGVSSRHGIQTQIPQGRVCQLRVLSSLGSQ